MVAKVSPTHQKLQQYYSQLRQSFPFFLKELWRFVGHPEPSRVQYDMADWLQNGPPRRILRGFRGVSKTYLTCAYVDWRFLSDPDVLTLPVSKSERHAVDSRHMIRSWMEQIPFLRHLKPTPADRDSELRFDVGPCTKGRRNPSCAVYGLTGQLPGNRADLIVPDDIETPENTMTHDQRERLCRQSEEFEAILTPKGEIVFLGSPHHEETLYDKLVDERGYTCRTWPLTYPAPNEPVPYLSPMLQADLDSGRFVPGDPVWPERFGRDYIANLGVSRTYFAMQYQMRSDLGDEAMYPLKLSDLIVMSMHRDVAPANVAWGRRQGNDTTAIEEIPSVGFGDDQYYAPIFMDQKKWVPYQGCKAFIDPAGMGKDELAWAICSHLFGMLYLKYVKGLHGGSCRENLEEVVTSLRDHGVNDLYIETNFGGDMLIRLIEPIITKFAIEPGKDDQFPNGWACAVLGVHNTGQKEVRIIDTLEPVMNQHRLIIDYPVAEDTAWAKQLTRITRQRNCLQMDDRIDATAGVVAQWKDCLHMDAGQMAANEEERNREASAKLYHEKATQDLGSWFGGSLAHVGGRTNADDNQAW